MTTPTYDLAYFRALFTSKSEEEWNDNDRDGVNTRCVLGHLDVLNDRCRVISGGLNPIAQAMDALFKPLANPLYRQGRVDWALAAVNNGWDTRYPQATPRQRVLAAVDDLINQTVVPTSRATVSEIARLS